MNKFSHSSAGFKFGAVQTHFETIHQLKLKQKNDDKCLKCVAQVVLNQNRLMKQIETETEAIQAPILPCETLAAVDHCEKTDPCQANAVVLEIIEPPTEEHIEAEPICFSAIHVEEKPIPTTYNPLFKKKNGEKFRAVVDLAVSKNRLSKLANIIEKKQW